jgi:two-component system copper resistance phosphate regulon response regulator CusR
MRILVAEDDELLARSLAKGLRERSHAVDLVRDGDSAITQGVLNDYDAIILDVMLPKCDGFEVARKLRTRDISAPILMLAARNRLGDKIQGLDAGADDYLTKPFEFEELLARLRALHRRQPSLAPEVLEVADLCVDTRSQTATRGKDVLPLTGKEYAMLEYLVRHAGTVVSRADISAHVWDDNHDPFSNTLEVYVGRLRRKVDNGHAVPLIHTRRGSGYILADLSAPEPALAKRSRNRD